MSNQRESKPPYRLNPKGDLLLFCNIDADAGFELDREVIGKDGDLLDETFNTILVKVRDGGFLPGDEVLQLLDPVHGFFPAVAVHLGFFFLLPEPENLVGDLSEIMPARPTITHHRYPKDEVKKPVDFKKASPITKLDVAIITAAEQQTMNYYMNQCGFYETDLGRRLYQEIAMVEEQHVSQYGSLMDVKQSWLEGWLCHEYTECYVYYSCYKDETDKHIKKIWETCLLQEIAHLHKAAECLKKYGKKEWQEVIPDGNFPELLAFKSTKNYVRDVIANTVCNTAHREGYVCVNDLDDSAEFFKYQKIVNANEKMTPSHSVIEAHIDKFGEDYRYEDSPSPIESLRQRNKDNTTLGRVKNCK